MKKLVIALLVLLPLATLPLVPSAKASSNRDWGVMDRDRATGEWRLSTDYTDHGQRVRFTGRLLIERERGRYIGRIYFDTLGEWERLQDVEVMGDTISFIRPKYEQRYSGEIHHNRMSGMYRDHLHRGEWEWHAER